MVKFDNLRRVARGEEESIEPSPTARRLPPALNELFRAPGNVAWDATVRASSIEGASTPASAVNDESHDTRWASETGDNQWLEVEFGSPQRINQVAIHWETASAAAYDVLARTPGGDWITAAMIDDGRGGVEVVTFEALTATAVRLDLKTRSTVYGFSIYELAIREDAAAEPGLTRVGGGRRAVSPVIGFDPASHRNTVHNGAPTINGLVLSDSTVPRMEMLEARVDLSATWGNPYDPDDIAIDAEFVAPSGTIARVPGFYHWDFERQVIEGQEQLIAAKAPQWLVRFTPTEAGEWRTRVTVTDRNGTATSEQKFHVEESTHPGFVRVSGRNRHYFAHDDGSTYFPIGLNLCWYADHGDGNRQTLAYDEWLEALAANGGNFIRVWMFSISFSPEWSDTGLGQYDERQPALWRLDHILRRCEELGIKVQLCLINHGQLSLGVNSEWHSNPYNAANGGPLSHPSEFLTDETARELFKRRLRYLMARYSHSPNIMAWEWFNEIEWTDGLIGDNLEPWLQEMTATVRAHDPNNHLFTISSIDDDRVYGPADIHFVQPHAYEVGNWPPRIRWTVSRVHERYGKPVFMGEIGVAQLPTGVDASGWNLHATNWASLTNGAAGGAMSWWWDGYIAPRRLWHRYRGIAAFVAGEQLDTGPGTVSRIVFETPGGVSLEASALHLHDRTLAWIRRTDATTVSFIAMDPEPTLDGFPPIRDAELPDGLIGPRHQVAEFWDTATGSIIGRMPVTGAPVGMPEFRTDVGVKIRED